MIAPASLINYWVWSEGWENWKSASLAEEVMSMSLVDRSFPSQIPNPPKPFTESKSKVNADKRVAVSNKNEPEDETVMRKHQRFDVELPVEVLVNDQSFKSKTVDISLGGIRVTDELPDWVAGYGTVIITLPDGSTSEVVCSVVEDQKLGDKFRLEILPSAQFDELKDYLESTKV